MHRYQKTIQAVIVAIVLIGALPRISSAEDVIEKAGVSVGMGVGNLFYVPAKAVSVVIGALSGALSFLVTGGDREVAEQVWRDTSTGPFYITPEMAKKSIGERPLLQEKK